MPHLRIEYSRPIEARVDMPALCRALQAALIRVGLFPVAGIRVRAYPADAFVVADDLPQNNFVALNMFVGAGRTTEQLQAAGKTVFDAAKAHLADLLAEPHFALSLDISVNDPAFSLKANPMHARLSGKTA